MAETERWDEVFAREPHVQRASRRKPTGHLRQQRVRLFRVKVAGTRGGWRSAVGT